MITRCRLSSRWNKAGRLAAALAAILAALVALAACGRGENVIYITATPMRDEQGTIIVPPTMTPDEPTPTPIEPTPNPPRPMPQGGIYLVQQGDTLGTIAEQYGLTVADLMAANALTSPDTLEVNQALTIPGAALRSTPANKLIPDSELVYSAAAADFNLTQSVKFSQGFLKAYSEDIDGQIMSGVEIIHFVAQNYGVNPRLLLALLEYRGGWLTVPYPDEQQINYPMGLVVQGRERLYRQMLDAADALNAGYYGWKYRGRLTLTLSDGTRLFFDASLNPGTVALQSMLSITATPDQWLHDVSSKGFFQTYLALFGDPFLRAIEPLTPPDLAQPPLQLPFAQGEEWVYTGGPHGGYNSGSAWAAIDLAPPRPGDDLLAAQGSCYVSPNWVTAAADGIIARSGHGYVVLDLDGDGNEYTGWTLVYLHIDNLDRIPAGTVVRAGDRLGHPSCEGGFSNGTHLHLARRYNGEWIPVECERCMPGVVVPPFVLGEWTFFGFANQEYQGYATRPNAADGYRQAEQTRDYEFNKFTW